MPLPRLRHHPSPISGTSGVSLRCSCHPASGRFRQAVSLSYSSFSFSLPSSCSPPSSRTTQSKSHLPIIQVSSIHSVSIPPANSSSRGTSTISPRSPERNFLKEIPLALRVPSQFDSSSLLVFLQNKNSNHSTSITHPAAPKHRHYSTSTPSSSKMPTYKLQDLPSLANLPEKSEVSIEGIPDGKVLLVKSGEKIHALSPRCTHYGAPLVGGVVDGERLTCPWHGGRF